MNFALLALIAGLLVFLVLRSLRTLGFGSWFVLRNTVLPPDARRERDLPRIAAWYRFTGIDRSRDVDDRTWDDLGMDEIFASMDLTSSAIGQQSLYARLRRPAQSAGDVEAFDATVERLTRDPETVRLLRRALRPLDDPRALQLMALFDSLGPRPAAWWICPILTLSALACLGGMTAEPRLLVPLLAIATTNVVIRLAFRGRIDPVSGALHMVPRLIAAGRTVLRAPAAELGPERDALARAVPPLDTLRTMTRWLALEPGQANEVVATLYEYANMILLFDVNAFVFAVDELRARRDALRGLFDTLGALDAALAVSEWRATRATWCRPRFDAPPKTLRIEGLVHPLVPAPVPNDVRIDHKSILITGSNMSGKTTLIRAVAANVVLAQTVATVLAHGYDGPPLVVRSSIGRADDLSLGKSYFLAELESVGRLVNAATGDGGARLAHLFVIDEIFRGTNTVERLAAATAVLGWLDRHDDIVLVSSHDLELIELLSGRYEPHHFREQVEGGELHFDYRMRAGASSTRNAIALLELLKFPPAIVTEALGLASELTAFLPSSHNEATRRP